MGKTEKKSGRKAAPPVHLPMIKLRFPWSAVALAVFVTLAPSPSYGGSESPDTGFLPREVWTGDFDGMAERRVVRALVVYNKMLFFMDRGTQRGGSHDLLMEFEKFVNKKMKTGTIKIKVLFIPVTRDRLLPALKEGLGDIAAANLTITPERKKEVDFGDPLLTGVSEIVVTGKGVPPLQGPEDLSGREVHLRLSSSYHGSLRRLNDALAAKGKPPVKIVPADEHLEDSDLLEMVSAGLIPAVVVDSHKAQFWAEIFEKITLHPAAAVSTGGQIAWAFRKGSPELRKVVNEFVKGHKKGTLLGNIFYKRYLKENTWARNALDEEELKKFRRTVGLFRKYAGQYNFDYLMTVALAYQESQLDHNRRSRAGAVGIMQMLPSTARDKNVAIPDITDLENNIHAGNKYLRFLSDRYFDDPAVDRLNRTLLTFASYNAGPARIAKLRKEASRMGLDPNLWFGNVEVVAAKRIGRETVQYVSNIFKYYVAYRLVVSRHEEREKRKAKNPPVDTLVERVKEPTAV